MLLLLLFPLLEEVLFISAIMDDAHVRQRIRVVFAVFSLAVVASVFSATQLLLSAQGVALLTGMYVLVGLVSAVLFVLFLVEVWGRKVSLEGEFLAHDDQVSLRLSSGREVLVTLNRVLNAAQQRRCECRNSDNSRLASYALAVLGEYLRSRVFHRRTGG